VSSPRASETVVSHLKKNNKTNEEKNKRGRREGETASVPQRRDIKKKNQWKKFGILREGGKEN